MKKVIISVISLMVVLCCLCSSSFAYSNKYYSLDVSSSFKKESDDGTTATFVKGSTVQIGVSVLDSSEKEAECELIKGILDGKKDAKDMIDYILGENPGFTKDNVTKSEITTISENKYKSVHLALKENSSYGMVYYHAYMIVAGEHLYLLTVVGIDSSDVINSSDVEDVLDSFTILNEDVYKGSKSTDSDKKESKDTIKIIVVAAAAAVIVLLVLGVVIVCSVKNKNK